MTQPGGARLRSGAATSPGRQFEQFLLAVDPGRDTIVACEEPRLHWGVWRLGQSPGAGVDRGAPRIKPPPTSRRLPRSARKWLLRTKRPSRNFPRPLEVRLGLRALWLAASCGGSSATVFGSMTRSKQSPHPRVCVQLRSGT
jgi:hypothetical protein